MSTENATTQQEQTTTHESITEDTSLSAQGSQVDDKSIKEKIADLGAAKTADVTTTQTVTPAAPAFTPNFKFKVHDEEKEIPEMFRSLIKDADTEKKVREIFEKADGLDVQKPKYERLKNEFQEVQTKYTNIDKSLKTLSQTVRDGDLGAFFDMINIPKSMVFKYVMDELKKQDAPPEERQRIDEFERIRRENSTLRQQIEERGSQYESESLQSKMMELDMAVQRPDVTQIAASFNSKGIKDPSGKVMTFRDAVIERGILAFQSTGQQIPVMQAVQDAIAYWSPWLQNQASAPQGGAPQGTTTEAQAPQAQKPALPNVGGRATSPIRQGPNNLDELKKIAANFANAN